MQFNFTNDRPIYIQLVEQLEAFIIAGQFSPGDKLPSVRDLANLAKVNPNTIQKALQELEDRKLIITISTSGKFITNDITILKQRRTFLASQKIQEFLQTMSKLGFSSAEIYTLLENTTSLKKSKPHKPSHSLKE